MNNTNLLFSAPKIPLARVYNSEKQYPIHRIFCVGRNYVAHAYEMGVTPDREAPFYFTKQSTAYVPSGAKIPYPPGTQNYHYEMELVIALGADAFNVSEENALNCVYGYACGLDMTRRDLQLIAREKGRPWDLGKAFEESAILGDIVPANGNHLSAGKLELTVNGEVKQNSNIEKLIWSIPELISHLSRYYHLQAGDLIYTGTPEGVGEVVSGDVLKGSIASLPDVELTIL